MTLQEAVASKKEMRRVLPAGRWIKRVKVCGINLFRFADPEIKGQVSEVVYFSVDDFESEWEVREERKEPTPIERLVMSLEIASKAARDLMGEAKAS